MLRIVAEELICLFGLELDVGGKRLERSAKSRRRARVHNLSGSSSAVAPARCSASACSAKSSSLDWESANACYHLVSDASSARTQDATSSCCSGGSFESSAIACSRSAVTADPPVKILPDAAQPYASPASEACPVQAVVGRPLQGPLFLPS